jgi:hypothetical protein
MAFGFGVALAVAISGREATHGLNEDAKRKKKERCLLIF